MWRRKEQSGSVNYWNTDCQEVKNLNTSYVTENGELDRNVSRGIQAGWMNRKKMTCDRRIGKEINRKVFKSVVWPAVTYGNEWL